MTMIFRRVSPYSGKTNEIQLPYTEAEFIDKFNKWQAGALLQEVFNTLTADQREFIATGLLPHEWDAIHVVPDDEELEEELDDEEL